MTEKNIHCCNAADSVTLHCTQGERKGEDRGLQAAMWGSELTTDLSFYAGSSHHQGENENAASGGALVDLGLQL